MYRILIVGLLTLAGCGNGLHVNEAAAMQLPKATHIPRDSQLVPVHNYKMDVKVVRAEIMSFYRWLLKTRQLLIIPAQANFPEEREVDPLTHLPIQEPELSDSEKKEKLRKLQGKTPPGKKL